MAHNKDQVCEGPSTSTSLSGSNKTTDNVLSNKSILGGPYCARNGLDVAALKSGDLEPLERESFTNGLILELWKQKDSVHQMHQWITALTPLELQRCLSGVTVQNLNKSCNDLMKKGQKLGKNKKKEELELLKQSLFHLPGSNAPTVHRRCVLFMEH